MIYTKWKKQNKTTLPIKDILPSISSFRNGEIKTSASEEKMSKFINTRPALREIQEVGPGKSYE